MCTCRPMLLCFGLQRVGLYDDLASYGCELLRAAASRRSRRWSCIFCALWSPLPLVVLVLFPFPGQHSFPPASTRCQHYCLAGQDCFGSPASCSASTSRCRHSLPSCPTLQLLMCGGHAYGFSMRLQSVCGLSIYTPCIVQHRIHSMLPCFHQ